MIKWVVRVVIALVTIALAVLQWNTLDLFSLINAIGVYLWMEVLVEMGMLHYTKKIKPNVAEWVEYISSFIALIICEIAITLCIPSMLLISLGLEVFSVICMIFFDNRTEEEKALLYGDGTVIDYDRLRELHYQYPYKKVNTKL